MSSAYDFSAVDIWGEEVSLATYRDKVILAVNVASQCGFTSQYTGLQSLWQTHRDQGLVVLGFPCDQFGHQEPGNDEEIRRFCTLNYNVDFPMFRKIEVNGSGAHPFWRWLKGEKGGVLGTEGIKWNFTKFLIGRDGQVRERYAPTTTPAALEADVVAALGRPAGS